MPLGSSSAAPVISPGPSFFSRGRWSRSMRGCSSMDGPGWRNQDSSDGLWVEGRWRGGIMGSMGGGKLVAKLSALSLSGRGRPGGHRQSAIIVVMQNIISVSGLSKTYASGFKALKNINLDIRQG